MAKMIDLTGQRFGRLTVLRLSHRIGYGTYWWCQCECGAEKPVKVNHLRGGKTVSCGCFSAEAAAARLVTHGLSQAAEHKIWVNMKARCTCPSNTSWDRYGGRGIEVCQRWLDSFEAFYEDMGPRPSSKHQIDRIDNTKGYEPSNCQWATLETQANNKRNNRMLTHGDTTLTVAEWSRLTGLPSTTIRNRLDQLGWDVEKALTAPLRPLSQRGVF